MKEIEIYKLGKRAKDGDEKAILEIIEFKSRLIKEVSCGDEDCYQTIILKVIKGIKNYKF